MSMEIVHTLFLVSGQEQTQLYSTTEYGVLSKAWFLKARSASVRGEA